MCFMSSPSMPAIPEVAPLPEPPTAVDQTVKDAGDEERRQRAQATGTGDTILTGGLGLEEEATTKKKTLLGG